MEEPTESGKSIDGSRTQARRCLRVEFETFTVDHLREASVASQQGAVDFILAQIADAGEVSANKMFGEYGLYCAGTFFGLVCDDQLFIKPTPGGRALLGAEAREGSPYPGAKPHLLVPGDAWDDAERLTKLVRITTAELPPPAAERRSNDRAR